MIDKHVRVYEDAWGFLLALHCSVVGAVRMSLCTGIIT